jgi:23S rRNA (guanosine2251-2'-O)-methyltransferase
MPPADRRPRPRRARRRQTRAAILVVPGRRPALEAVRAGAAREVLVSDEARSTAGLREVVEAAGVAGVPVRRVPSDAIDDLVGDDGHQGVLARVRPPVELSEGQLAAMRWDADALVVVLDGVTDPGNLGAVARTAEAAGAAALVVRRRRGAGVTAVSLRASAGALLHLPLAVVPNVPRILQRLQEHGFWVAGLDERGPSSVGESRPPPGRVAVVLGGEGAGLSRLARDRCDEVLRIPMRGRVPSLNVSVAAGVALFGYALPRERGDG